MVRSPLDAWLVRRLHLPDRTALTDAAVAAWQMAELRRTLVWARAVSPFHSWRLAGLDLDTLRDRADLELLPRMEPGDLARPGLLAVSQSEVARVVTLASSGTSGPPKRVLFTETDLERTLQFFAVGMATLVAPGDAVLVLLPGRRENGVADLLARALPNLGTGGEGGAGGGARAVLPPEGEIPGNGELEYMAREILPALIREQGVTRMVAAPTELHVLLRHEAMTEACQGRIRTVLSSVEPLSPELRTQVEQTWRCKVFDHWGMTETGYGGGVECRAHSGYHLREADLLVEVADPQTGCPLPAGEQGEILVSTLGRRALPLVRYRTGDAGIILPGPCPCGSPLRRLGPVAGRLDADGKSIHTPAKGRGAAI